MNRTLVRWGLWSLPVAGLLTLWPWIGLFIGGGGPNPTTDREGFARSVTSPLVTIAGLDYIAGTICLLFGVIALYAVLADGPAPGWASAGLIGGVIAMTLVIGIWFVLVLADAVLGDVYLSGQHGVGAAFDKMSGGHWTGRAIPFFAVGVVAGLVGAIGLSVALWRSGKAAKWIAVVFAVAFALEVVSGPDTLFGAILLIVSGILIARELQPRQVAPTN